MATLPERIAETFIARLTETKKVDEKQLELLRELLKKDATVKPDDLIKVFTLTATEELT